MASLSDDGIASRAAIANNLATRAANTLQTLPVRLNPEWILSLGAGIAQVAQCGATLLNDVLLASFDLRWPDLSAAASPIETMWMLPKGQVGRVCATRALFACRGQLARSVDSSVRRRARAMVGDATFTALLALDRDRLSTAGRALPGNDADILSTGWSLLRDACSWKDERLRRLCDLMLPPSASRSDARTPAVSAVMSEHQQFIERLPHLFPEHSWLFGSEPARLISA